MQLKPDDIVYHVSKDKEGSVVSYIGGEQERYYVYHSKQVWSVPRDFLVKIASNENK